VGNADLVGTGPRSAVRKYVLSGAPKIIVTPNMTGHGMNPPRSSLWPAAVPWLGPGFQRLARSTLGKGGRASNAVPQPQAHSQAPSPSGCAAQLGAQNEFTLAAIAQNLLARKTAARMPAPVSCGRVCIAQR
jgi:hypothetical protein